MCEVLMKKYDPLYNYLLHRKEQNVTLEFAEIENIINAKLPKSAYIHTQWWGNSNTKEHPHSRAWLDAGFKTVDMMENIIRKRVVFCKMI